MSVVRDSKPSPAQRWRDAERQEYEAGRKQNATAIRAHRDRSTELAPGLARDFAEGNGPGVVARVETTETRRRKVEALRDALFEHGKGERPLHPDLAGRLAIALEQLLSGEASSLLKPFRNRHRSKRSFTERNCIEAAVRYEAACAAGIVEDAHPRTTVRRAFGGGSLEKGPSTDTVRKWIKKSSFKATDFPRDPLDPRKKDPRYADPSVITELMKAAGRVWFRHFAPWRPRQAGRTRAVYSG